MSPDTALDVRGLGKRFAVYGSPLGRLLHHAAGKYFPPAGHVQAFADVTFDVRRGEAVAVLGRNGSGKSTLMQILAGTMRPSEGKAQIHGQVTSILELGTGFSWEFTGRQNARIGLILAGVSEEDLDELVERAVVFSGLGAQADQITRYYSSGMFVRLAFAVATAMRPDLLILDEALAVGDREFYRACRDRIDEMRACGTALLMVSHDEEALQTMCDRAVLLDKGLQSAFGPCMEVMYAYKRVLAAPERP